MSSANWDDLIAFFLTSILSLSFSYLTALAKTYSDILNKSAESGHPCFIFDFRGNSLSFYFH
jgi:hypothetical protein